jgi:hypothetical protein
MSEAVDKLINLCVLGKVEHDGCLNPIPGEVEPPDTRHSKTNKSKNKVLLDMIETHWGQRLQFNETTQQVEMDGKVLENIEWIYARLARELFLDIPKRKAFDFVVYIAKKYSYTPCHLHPLGLHPEAIALRCRNIHKTLPGITSR